MFRTNHGCNTGGSGPSGVGPPAMNHVGVKPNQRVVTWWQILDQSYSFCLKPKYKTVSSWLSHWLITHPGVGVFLGFEESNEKTSGWSCDHFQVQMAPVLRCGNKQLFVPLKAHRNTICFCPVFLFCVFSFCLESLRTFNNRFSPLLFLTVFSRCCLGRFWVSSAQFCRNCMLVRCCVLIILLFLLSAVIVMCHLVFFVGFSWYCFCLLFCAYIRLVVSTVLVGFFLLFHCAFCVFYLLAYNNFDVVSYGCPLHSPSALFSACLVVFVLSCRVTVFDLRENNRATYSFGPFTSLFFVPRTTLSHYDFIDHFWTPVYLHHWVCACYCACRADWGRDHKCIGSAQVCLPSFLVGIYVR